MYDLLWAFGHVCDLWYALPLIVAVSLVYAATRHERLSAILGRGLGCGVTIAGFMTLILLILWLVSLWK
jgi:hypothetical protein